MNCVVLFCKDENDVLICELIIMFILCFIGYLENLNDRFIRIVCCVDLLF